jgi:hypothetical protein
LEILQSALEEEGFEIAATEEKNPDDEIYENLKKQTEKMFLDDDEGNDVRIFQNNTGLTHF